MVLTWLVIWNWITTGFRLGSSGSRCWDRTYNYIAECLLGCTIRLTSTEQRKMRCRIFIRLCHQINTYKQRKRKQPDDSFSQPHGHSGAKLAHKSCHLLCQNSNLWTPYLDQSMDIGGVVKVVTLGKELSKLQQLTIEICLQIALPIALQ